MRAGHAIALLALAAVSCGHGGAARPGAPAAFALPTPDRIAGEVIVRQTVQAEHGGKSFSQEMVLQKRGDTLTVVGLAPFGKLWSVVQRGASIEAHTYVPEAVPFPPEAMLADVYRALGTWLEGPPPQDGERAGERDGERVRERWSAGRLVERELVPTGGGQPVRVRASGPPVSGVPVHLEIANQRLGYRLDITSSCAAACPE